MTTTSLNGEEVVTMSMLDVIAAGAE